MKNKLIPLHVLAVAVVINVYAFILRHPVEFGSCDKLYLFNGKKTCVDNIYYSLGEPLQIYGLSLLVISITLFFLKKTVIHAWWKFGITWTVLTAIFVYKAPTYGHPFFPIEKGTVSLFMAGLFILISLILIIRKSRQLRKENGI